MEIDLTVNFLNGKKIKKQTTLFKKKNKYGSAKFIRFEGRKYNVKLSTPNSVLLFLCDVCGDQLAWLQPNEGTPKNICYNCSFVKNETEDKLIIKSQLSSTLKKIGGFVVARHPVYGYKVFDKLTTPHKESDSGGKNEKNWKITKVFSFNEKWTEITGPKFWAHFRIK